MRFAKRFRQSILQLRKLHVELATLAGPLEQPLHVQLANYNALLARLYKLVLERFAHPGREVQGMFEWVHQLSSKHGAQVGVDFGGLHDLFR